MYKVLDTVGVSPQDKAEIATYQLKDVSHVWYDKWKGERLVEAGPVDWELFKSVFFGRFFPIELRNERRNN